MLAALDSLHPQLYPQFRPQPLRYHTYALAAMEAHRQAAAGYTPRFHCVPDEGNVAITGSRQFEGRVTLPVGTYLWAIAGTSQQSDGFDLQIRDIGPDQELFDRRVNWKNVTGQGSGTPSTPLFILPKPHLVIEPGLLLVQVFNKSTSNNQIQVVLYTMQPERAPR